MPDMRSPNPRTQRRAILGAACALCLSSAAQADNPYLDREGDVVAQATLAASGEALSAVLLDLKQQELLWPEGCTRKWEHSSTSQGVGASARLTYRAGSWRRRLTATLSQADERRIVLDHAGKRGFVITWDMSQAEAGTALEMHTWIMAPPRPFKRAYFERVHPRWTECHQGFLQNLGRVTNQ